MEWSLEPDFARLGAATSALLFAWDKRQVLSGDWERFAKELESALNAAINVESRQPFDKFVWGLHPSFFRSDVPELVLDLVRTGDPQTVVRLLLLERAPELEIYGEHLGGRFMQLREHLGMLAEAVHYLA